MAPPLRRVETTGRPELVGLERSVQQHLDGLRGDIRDLDAGSVAYTPSNPADWVSPAPTTAQEALDRLAASAGAHPVP